MSAVAAAQLQDAAHGCLADLYLLSREGKVVYGHDVVELVDDFCIRAKCTHAVGSLPAPLGSLYREACCQPRRIFSGRKLNQLLCDLAQGIAA